MDDTENKIRNILKIITKNDDPTNWGAEYIFYPGEIDSLDMATFALNLEEAFNVKIPDDILANMYSIENAEQSIRLIKG